MGNNIKHKEQKSGGESVITDHEFNRIVLYVKNNFGIDLSQKRTLITGRLENYLLRNGYESYDQYMAKVEQNPSGEEATNLVNVLTTNHTYFMRESVHFDFMKQEILPVLRKKEAAKKDLRIWSAASSTGEEPYTIAMILMDFFGVEHSAWDTKVLATDISTKVLAHASRGVYLREQIDPLPAKWKQRYFKRISEEEYVAKDVLKKELIFRQFNLMNPLPFRKRFHIIFVRNVMIYFEDDTKYQLLDRMYEFMEPGGYLFIGTTEGLDKKRTRFQYVKPSIYRKPE